MRGGYLAIIGMMRGGFPDIQWTLEETIAEGDKVAARFTMPGTHQGTFFGLPPTGKKIVVQAMNFLPADWRPIRRRTWPARFTWVATANRCSASSLDEMMPNKRKAAHHSEAQHARRPSDARKSFLFTVVKVLVPVVAVLACVVRKNRHFYFEKVRFRPPPPAPSLLSHYTGSTSPLYC